LLRVLLVLGLGVPSEALAIAGRGLDAWRHGDFETLEAILDPQVEWLAIEPGEWDCHGRDDVLRTLRERHEQGFTKGRVELVEAGPATVVLLSWPAEIGGPEWPEETATVVTFDGGRVTRMQDYATRDAALSAVG
jgi:ketosteroid isomerase-like protein